MELNRSRIPGPMIYYWSQTCWIGGHPGWRKRKPTPLTPRYSGLTFKGNIATPLTLPLGNRTGPHFTGGFCRRKKIPQGANNTIQGPYSSNYEGEKITPLKGKKARATTRPETAPRAASCLFHLYVKPDAKKSDNNQPWS